MRTFITVFKNDLYRLREQSTRVILFCFLSLAAAVLAIFLSLNQPAFAKIAVVSKSELNLYNSNLKVTYLAEKPPLSALILKEYDAIISYDNNQLIIDSIADNKFVNNLKLLLEDPNLPLSKVTIVRDTALMIMGFIMMFILMQGSVLMFLFAQDKQRQQIRRIAAAPVYFLSYLSAHGFFVFIFLLFPLMLVLSLAKIMPGVDIGFSLTTYFLLLSLLCALSTVYSLLLNAFINNGETANMLISVSVILTSLLAGSFYPVDSSNKIFNILISILPQKVFLSLVESINGNEDFFAWIFKLLYLLVFIVIIGVVAVIKTHKDYVNN